MIHYITTIGIGSPWVLLELEVLKREGIPFQLHAMRQPDSIFYSSDSARNLHAQTHSIYPIKAPAALWAVLLAPILFHRRFFACLANALFGQRESMRARIAGIAHVFVACYWARQLNASQVRHIHSQWAHSTATIGMYGAWLLNTTFSFTGHGADLWRDRVALRDKIKRSCFIVCISEFHRKLYLDNGAHDDQLIFVYCGIDPKQFFPKELSRKEGQPFRIRSSGRLIEKKGFEYLIDACKILVDMGIQLECKIVGSGPLASSLAARVKSLGLEGIVEVTGKAINYEEMNDFLHGGDAYCLPCVWAADGDADGLPAVLMEAMASGLPVVSTDLVGIPDLITTGVNGLLVPPQDAKSLADSLKHLHDDQALGTRLAAAGRETVQKRFNLETCVDPLIEKYREILSS